jgi:transcriptional regulator GlxA family with amidase domain
MKMSYLLYEGVEPVDLAAIGVMSMGRRVIPELSYETIAASRGPVRFANGLKVLADHSFDEVIAVDVLLVPGGPGWRAASKDSEILSFIKRVAPSSLVCSICTGAMILAEAGMLDGTAATTKVPVVPPEVSPLDELRERFPAVEARAALIVDSGAVVTGGGVTLCIDVVLHLISRRYGEPAAQEIAHIMEYGAARQANSERFASTTNFSESEFLV